MSAASLAEELPDWLPWAEALVVKRGVSWQAADSLHPSAARELIEAAARRAVERLSGPVADRPKPLRLVSPLELRMDFHHPGQADMAAIVPGFEREGDRGVRYRAEDALTLYRAFLSAARISRTADD